MSTKNFASELVADEKSVEPRRSDTASLSSHTTLYLFESQCRTVVDVVVVVLVIAVMVLLSAPLHSSWYKYH